ncbi:hypothetical protein D9M68_872350 [compost metagenome]
MTSKTEPIWPLLRERSLTRSMASFISLANNSMVAVVRSISANPSSVARSAVSAASAA